MSLSYPIRTPNVSHRGYFTRQLIEGIHTLVAQASSDLGVARRQSIHLIDDQHAIQCLVDNLLCRQSRVSCVLSNEVTEPSPHGFLLLTLSHATDMLTTMVLLPFLTTKILGVTAE